jgi:hypothetical protein
MKIDWRQKSTIRGSIWLFTGLVALWFAWHGKDAGTVLAVGAAVAGGVGVAVSDK